MSAADLFDDMLRQAVVPITKPLGWKRNRTNFRRRIGKTVHVLNFQASQASISTERFFT